MNEVSNEVMRDGKGRRSDGETKLERRKERVTNNRGKKNVSLSTPRDDGQ